MLPTTALDRRTLTRLAAALFLLAALLWSFGPSAHLGTQTAAAATKCSVSGKKLGPTYTTSLSVTGTSCAQGYKLVTAYYKCRTKAGKKNGRCTTKVLGFACTEKRKNVIDTQFDATVSCKKSKAKISHAYTQYT